MSLSPRDLSMILQPPPGEEIRFAQARVLEWDLSVPGGTAISWRGITLPNVPVLSAIDIFSIQPGDIVGIIGWAPRNGLGSWWIVGKIVTTDKINDEVVITQGSIVLGDGSDLIVKSDNDDRWIRISEGVIEFNTVSGVDAVSAGFIRIETFDDGNPYLQMSGPAPTGMSQTAWLALASHNFPGGEGFARITSNGNEAGISDVGAQLLLTDTANLRATGITRVLSETSNVILNAGDGIVMAANTGNVSSTADGFTRFSTGGNFIVSADDGIILNANGVGGGGNIVGNADGYVMWQSNIDEIWIPNQNTSSTAAANMSLSISGDVGVIWRITSGRKYKTDIEDYTISISDLEGVKPSTWVDKQEKKRHPDTDRRHVGFIAEELAQTPLRPFVDFDEDGHPDAVAYDRLSVAALTALQEVSTRLSAIEKHLGIEPDSRPDATRIPDRMPPPPMNEEEKALCLVQDAVIPTRHLIINPVLR